MRVAVVVQRYGPEILGGAETHAAVMAGILAREHDVEVLTTTAREYQEWRNSFPAGRVRIDGMVVRRFPVVGGRAPGWPAMSRLLHEEIDPSGFGHLSETARAAFARRVRAWPDALQEEFIRGQGPVAPDLVRHLRDHAHDRVLFVTYLYPTTYDGLMAVAPGRSRVVPTLHDEPPAYLPVFGRRLARSRLLCSTDAEVALLPRLYPGVRIAARRIGYGIPLPSRAVGGPRARYGERPYLLFAGRIDRNKGVLDLLRWYELLRRERGNPPDLVLIGEAAIPLPSVPGLQARGVVSDEEKIEWMRGAVALVHPSPFESLGIVLLEAMACSTPIVVRGQSEVMVEHCRRSGAGLWVRDAPEFVTAIGRLLDDAAMGAILGRSGREYVEREYGIEAYAERLLAEFRPGDQRGNEVRPER